MKIARIAIDSKELYGYLTDTNFQPIKVRRNTFGIESFFSDDPETVGDEISLQNEEFYWLPPVARPGKILCIGRNYAKHAREQGIEPDTKPLIFSKFSTSMIGHLHKIPFPDHTKALDYEVELAVIIGKTATKIDASDNPLDYVYGFTVANDLTARDVQKAEKQWTRGKGFDGSLPIGPTIVKKEDVTNLENQEIWLTVNGDKRQGSKIANMIFSIPYLIHYISQTITLQPGDIILTGTPEGVGYYMKPISTLNVNDQVACGVTGIGELRFEISQTKY